MESKNLGRGRVFYTRCIYQGTRLSCARFIIVSEQFAGVCVLRVFFVVSLQISLFIHLLSVY